MSTNSIREPLPPVHSLTAYDPLHFAEKPSARPEDPH